jgi:hypothetical protein
MNLPLLIATSITLAWDAVDPTDTNSISNSAHQGHSVDCYRQPTRSSRDGLDFGTTYYFAVTSFLGGYESDFSNEITYTPTPEATPTPSPTAAPTPESTPTPDPDGPGEHKGWYK